MAVKITMIVALLHIAKASRGNFYGDTVVSRVQSDLVEISYDAGVVAQFVTDGRGIHRTKWDIYSYSASSGDYDATPDFEQGQQGRGRRWPLS